MIIEKFLIAFKHISEANIEFLRFFFKQFEEKKKYIFVLYLMLFLMIIISGIFTGDYEMTGPEKYAIYTILLIDIIALPIGWIILSRQQSNRRKKVLIYSIRNRYDRILDNCGFNPNLGGRK